MSYPWTSYKTWTTGEVLTASDLNNSFTNVITNTIPTSIDDYSTNAALMQTTADPYPAAAESLATDLSGEIARLRYVINQMNGGAQWYIDPLTDLSTIKSGTLTIAGAKTFSSDVAITSASTTALNIAAANSGATVGALISNTSNTGSSKALLDTKVAGTTADDPYHTFTISGGQVWAIGLDNSTSDSFKISSNATLGTNDYLTVTTGGDVYTEAYTQYGATSTIVGWVSFTTQDIYYKRIGKLVYVWFSLNGTSNSTSVTFTLPYTSSNDVTSRGTIYAVDNGGTATVGRYNLPNNSATVTCNSSISTGTWTNSGTKQILGQFFYQTV